MTPDEQARARLVEIALREAELWPHMSHGTPEAYAYRTRKLAGFRDPSHGSWCAAGLTAAMDDAGLVVPAPGTPARRGAIALLDFVTVHGAVEWPLISSNREDHIRYAQPGDIIAWLQHPPPEEWRQYGDVLHAFAPHAAKSMCDLRNRANGALSGMGALAIPSHQTTKCSACSWETRKGHVAVIVAVDDDSLTTVGWNEGPKPGRVIKRRLWRDPERRTIVTLPSGAEMERYVPRASTVLWRRPGGLRGIARPVVA